MIGRIRWEATDSSKGKIIAHGDLSVRMQDISLQGVSSDARLFHRQIKLDREFTIGLAASAAESPAEIGGFGLTGGRQREPTFSWEWFTIEEPTKARKLQEGGRLGIAIHKTSRGWEIARTEFTTDISLRIIPMEANSDPRKPKWRIKILKGSFVDWIPTK